MLDILVPEVGLQASSIDASIGEFEAARVPQHVRMNPETKSGRFTKADILIGISTPYRRRDHFGQDGDHVLVVTSCASAVQHANIQSDIER
jgi:hypothetical protein